MINRNIRSYRLCNGGPTLRVAVPAGAIENRGVLSEVESRLSPWDVGQPRTRQPTA